MASDTIVTDNLHRPGDLYSLAYSINGIIGRIWSCPEGEKNQYFQQLFDNRQRDPQNKSIYYVCLSDVNEPQGTDCIGVLLT